jgi:predicted RNase H-like nuclease
MPQPGPRGALRSPLPYDVLAGVEPCLGGWLVVPGNIQGITMAPQPAFVVATMADVLDYRPSFTVVALHAPVGLPDKADDRRACDLAARRALGRRGGAAVLAPPRAALGARNLREAQESDPTMDIVRWRLLPKAVEAVTEVQSWRQRTVWEVNPELAFLQMNEGIPLRHPKRSQLGRQERRNLLDAKLPGIDRVMDQRGRGVRESRLLDAAADLWTARRIMARAITRLADPPEWDADGVRMDIVY